MEPLLLSFGLLSVGGVIGAFLSKARKLVFWGPVGAVVIFCAVIAVRMQSAQGWDALAWFLLIAMAVFLTTGYLIGGGIMWLRRRSALARSKVDP